MATQCNRTPVRLRYTGWMQMNTLSRLAAICATLWLTGCAGFGGPSLPEISTVQSVDLDRFMGRWYVIAHIPTFIEDEAFNATETYRRRDADTIDTVFSFNNGAFDGKFKTYTPVGTVRPNTGGAIWGMQFIWPFKAEYRIVWLNADYSVTVIGRDQRDYVWIMSREPNLPDAVRARIERFLIDEGYDLGKLRDVPQSWPET